MCLRAYSADSQMIKDHIIIIIITITTTFLFLNSLYTTNKGVLHLVNSQYGHVYFDALYYAAAIYINPSLVM